MTPCSAVRKLVEDTPPPPGVKAYVTGAAALTADQSAAGEKGVILVTLLTFVVIIVMLLWVYRSIVTVVDHPADGGARAVRGAAGCRVSGQ